MQVSVIIPVYNTARYLAECLASVLSQPEVAEAIFVDDGSKDNSLEICHQLAQQHGNRVKVLTSPGGVNAGSAVARNVGIEAAVNPYIAFIDSDDYYLPNRFENTKKIFEANPDADGVYEATENFFEEYATSFSTTHLLEGVPKLHMIDHKVAPEDLLEVLLQGNSGIFLLQGLCVKQSIFERSGTFNPEYRITQDMLMIKKMAAVGKLLPGDLEKPVSMRRVHNTNISFSTFKDTHPTRFLEGDTLFDWAIHNNLSNKVKNLLFMHRYKKYMYQQPNGFQNETVRRKYIRLIVQQYPEVVKLKSFWKLVPIVGRFI